MNQEKMGKFIANCRKKQNLTQEEIAERIGITSQSVSKWERGINSPDLSLIMPLCNILNISVEELLFGEKIKEQGSANKTEEKRNKDIIGILKMYEKKNTKKYISIICFIIFLLFINITLFLGIYFFSNYNKIKIFSVFSTDEVVKLDGKIIFNPKYKIVTINDIEYIDKYTGTDKEIKTKSLKIALKIKNKTILEYGELNYNDNLNYANINDQLDELFSNNIINSEEYSGIKEKEITDLKLVITYIDEDDEIKQITTKLKCSKEFSNNSIIYN